MNEANISELSSVPVSVGAPSTEDRVFFCDADLDRRLEADLVCRLDTGGDFCFRGGD